MKIKLVTFAPHPNFGTCLQSYALNKVLRDMGHDVEFIYNGNEKAPKPISYYIKAIAKCFIPKQMVKQIKAERAEKCSSRPSRPPYILKLPNNYFRYWLSLLPGYERVYKKLKCRTLQWKKVYKFTFEDGNYKMKRLYIKKQYDEVVKEADLFITGSDQIWNPYCGGFNPMMFLEFAGDKKRVAYSSSISLPSIPKNIEQRMRDDLMKFTHIAVREQKSVELLSALLGRDDIHLVVDPTILVPTLEWCMFAKRAKIEFELPRKYIFCYFIGQKRRDVYEQMVQEVKDFTGISEVITLECYNRDICYGGGLLYKDGGPYEWVYLLSHASYVCMDSFHATIFALKFHKEFVHAMKNSDSEAGSQNTRMYDLLSRYGLLYKNYSGIGVDWQSQIDFTKIDGILEEDVRESLAYLKYEIG